MDDRSISFTNSFPGIVDIASVSTGKSSDGNTTIAGAPGNLFDSAKVARGSCWKTSLDDIYIEADKLLGNLKLLFSGHRCSR